MNKDEKQPKEEEKSKSFSSPEKLRLLKILGLVVLLLLLLYQNYHFIVNDTLFRATDGHFYPKSVVWYEYLVQGQRNTPLTEQIHQPFSPALYIFSQIFYKFMGLSQESARLSLLPFYLVFLLSMFGIGYEYGKYAGGIAVMSLGAASPHILEFSRFYFLDFPQTAMTSLAFYLIIKNRDYRNRLLSIALGLVLAAAFLTKWSTGLFIIFPLIWFLIPPAVKSVKSFAALVIFLLYSSLPIYTLYRFYFSPGPASLFDNWKKAWLLYVLIPTVILILIILIFEFFRKKDKSYRESGLYGVVNFSITTMTVFTLALPWYLSVARGLGQKFRMDVTAMHSHTFPSPDWLFFLRTSFNLAPVLILIGLVFMIISKKDRYRLAVLPLTLIVITVFMHHQWYFMRRYMLSLVIYLAPLAGFWVSRTGKLKPWLTSGITILSLVTALGWLFYSGTPGWAYRIQGEGIPPNASPLREMIFWSKTPSKRIIKSDLSELFRLIPGSPDKRTKIMLLHDRGNLVFNVDYLNWSAYRNGKPTECVILSEIDSLPQNLNPEDRDQQKNLKELENVLIYHFDRAKTDELLSKLQRVVPDAKMTPATFEIGEGHYLTYVRLERNYSSVPSAP